MCTAPDDPRPSTPRSHPSAEPWQRPHLPPALLAVTQAVAAACSDVQAGDLVLVACSGGPDSLALAAGVAALQARPRPPAWRAGAVVVDHGLQDGSAEVAAEAAATCTRLGLTPVVVESVDVVATGQGPEAAARRARHDAFDRVAVRSGACGVLLAHTRDDQAEQVLLGLARGSGARSLAGMAASSGLLRRPLLRLPRATTHQALAEACLSAWHDPQNTDSAFTRARVRSRVLPLLEADLGPGVAAALARTADLLREDAEVLDDLAATVLEQARAGGPGLDVAVLAAAPPALRRRALRSALLAAGAPAQDVHRVHVEAVDALVVAWRGQERVDLPGHLGVRRACGRLMVTQHEEDAAGGRAGHG